jgi:hypothetical protein
MLALTRQVNMPAGRCFIVVWENWFLYGFACLWLWIALLGLLGLLHAVYSRGRYSYIGFAIAVVAAGTIVAFLAMAVFL